MDKGIYTAMTAASANMRRQATIANNLANANTNGYRASVDGVFSVPVQGEGQFASRVPVTARTIGISGAPGSVAATGRNLDVALHQQAWLSVMDGQGNPALTRAGSLTVDANGQLLTQAGHQVLDPAGQPLNIPPYERLDIGGDGTITVIPEGQNAVGIVNAGQLGVFVSTAAAVERGDDGLFRPRPGAPAPAVSDGMVLTPGALEGSNVNPATELVNMIEAQRSYETSVRMLQTFSENANTANSLMSTR